MQVGGTFLGRGGRYLVIAVVFSFQFACMNLCSVVYAQSTSVNTKVDNGDVHPALSLTDTAPLSVTTMPLELSGSVQDISQIQVYIDNVFSVTVPLSAGATSFSASLVIPSGVHTLKLVGISPFADVSPEATISVTYTPPQQPGNNGGGTTSGSGSSNPNSGSSGSTENGGGAIITHDASTATTTYVTPAQTTSLPGWLYSGLLAVDIARPGDTDSEIVKMLQRFLILVPGLALLVFARPVLYGWYTLRYKWFGLKECKLSKHSHHAPLMHFRVIGLVLIFAVFSFL